MENQYKKTFLKQVVVRIDFPSPIEVIRIGLPPSVNEVALRLFPIAEPRQPLGREGQLSAQKEKTRGEEAWRFHGGGREKTLSIAPKWLFIVYTRYPSFETLRSEFQNVLTAFCDAFPGEHASGVSLRYINVLDMADGDPLAWEDFLNPHLLGVINFFPERQRIARVFHNLELAFGDMNLRYQFGIHNLDFPAPIRRRQFVLDLDAYAQGSFTKEDISRHLGNAHTRVETLFEASITDRLREIMSA